MKITQISNVPTISSILSEVFYMVTTPHYKFSLCFVKITPFLLSVYNSIRAAQINNGDKWMDG